MSSKGFFLVFFFLISSAPLLIFAFSLLHCCCWSTSIRFLFFGIFFSTFSWWATHWHLLRCQVLVYAQSNMAPSSLSLKGKQLCKRVLQAEQCAPSSQIPPVILSIAIFFFFYLKGEIQQWYCQNIQRPRRNMTMWNITSKTSWVKQGKHLQRTKFRT